MAAITDELLISWVADADGERHKMPICQLEMRHFSGLWETADNLQSFGGDVAEAANSLHASDDADDTFTAIRMEQDESMDKAYNGLRNSAVLLDRAMRLLDKLAAEGKLDDDGERLRLDMWLHTL